MEANEFLQSRGLSDNGCGIIAVHEDDLTTLLEEYKQQSFWTPIDPDNLPEGEVLAVCFDKNHPYHKEKLIGNIEFCENSFMCDNDETTIFNVTHYHDINKHDLK